jgi:hypothetical protein
VALLDLATSGSGQGVLIDARSTPRRVAGSLRMIPADPLMQPQRRLFDMEAFPLTPVIQ